MKIGEYPISPRSLTGPEKLSYHRLLADLIRRYLDERDEKRRTEVFHEIKQLSELSCLLSSKNRK